MARRMAARRVVRPRARAQAGATPERRALRAPRSKVQRVARVRRAQLKRVHVLVRSRPGCASRTVARKTVALRLVVQTVHRRAKAVIAEPAAVPTRLVVKKARAARVELAARMSSDPCGRGKDVA